MTGCPFTFEGTVWTESESDCERVGYGASVGGICLENGDVVCSSLSVIVSTRVVYGTGLLCN